MRKSLTSLSFCIVALSSMGLTAYAHAQQGMGEKDPARWTTEDTTPKARYQTLKKEADAAYRENLKQCKSMSSGARAACTKDAKSAYQEDLAKAKMELKQ